MQRRIRECLKRDPFPVMFGRIELKCMCFVLGRLCSAKASRAAILVWIIDQERSLFILFCLRYSSIQRPAVDSWACVMCKWFMNHTALDNNDASDLHTGGTLNNKGFLVTRFRKKEDKNERQIVFRFGKSPSPCRCVGKPSKGTADMPERMRI